MSGYGFSVGSSGYDDVDRLVNWQRSDTNLDQSWNLSAVGNWNSITENTSTQNRTHGPTHELLTVTSQSVTHDAKGNMTLIPAVLRPGSDPLKMKWDFENKLIAADTDNDSMDDIFYKFDALGRRVGRDDGTANVVYFQHGQQTIADYPSGTAAGSPTYTYVYASYIDEPVMRGGSGGLRYYHRNQQYSITAVSDGGGSVVERYAYSAYGQVTIADASGSVISDSAFSNRYTYTGREWDEDLSLYHYRARMYDAVAGRFVSRDPIKYWASLNMFNAKMMLSAVDPTGLMDMSAGSPGNPVIYDIYDMVVQPPNTVNTVIAEVEAWIEYESKCKILCEECTGDILITAGFNWRGLTISSDHIRNDSGFICNQEGKNCSKLSPNKDKNGMTGKLSLGSLGCKGGELTGSIFISAFTGNKDGLEDIVDSTGWPIVSNSTSILEIIFKVKITECGSDAQDIKIIAGPAKHMWTKPNSPMVLPKGEVPGAIPFPDLFPR